MKQTKQRTMRYWFNLLFFPSLIGFLAYLQLTIYMLTRPANREICCVTPLDMGFPYEDVTFVANDGAVLSGWYIPSQNKAVVILLHGYGGSRLGMMYHANALAQSGFGVLMYDERASGESGGDRRSFGWQDIEDLERAITFLQNRNDVDSDKIGILGSSTGAEIALNAAGQMEALKAVVAEGAGFATGGDIPPPANLRERFTHPSFSLLFRVLAWETGIKQPQPIRELIGRISPRPLLLVSTGQDLELRQNTIYFEAAAQPKEHWNIPETGHGGAATARPEEYAQKIVTFFQNALLND